MRYLSIFISENGESDAPPSEEEIEKMGALMQEMGEKGVLVTADGLPPSTQGVRVRKSNGQYTVVDGPFTESKEVIAGFSILNVASKEEAVYWTRRFMDVAEDGICEIREMYDEPAFPPA